MRLESTFKAALLLALGMAAGAFFLQGAPAVVHAAPGTHGAGDAIVMNMDQDRIAVFITCDAPTAAGAPMLLLYDTKAGERWGHNFKRTNHLIFYRAGNSLAS